jgi:hypothetical protein
MDSKGILAILVTLGCFLLLGLYVIRGEQPPDVILLIVSSSLAGVLAYYFGAHNGNITGLANAATQVSAMAAQLANQAIEKRQQTTTVLVTPTEAPPSS